MLEFCQSGLFLGEKAKQRQPFRRVCFGGQLAAIMFDVQLTDDDPLVQHGGSLLWLRDRFATVSVLASHQSGELWRSDQQRLV